MELKSFPSFDYVQRLFGWGLSIDDYVNWSITPEQYKQITKKDYVAPASN